MADNGKKPRVDFSKFNDEQLEQLIQDAGIELEERKKQRYKEALDKVKDIAASVGMTPKELILGTRKTPTKKRAQATQKYKNPEGEETWSGRGKMPEWVSEQLARGKTLEELKVS